MALIIARHKTIGETGTILTDKTGNVVAERWGNPYTDLAELIELAKAGHDLHITDHMIETPYPFDTIAGSLTILAEVG